MELSGRLKQIADLIPICRTVADVGTDHGYIPIYCVSHDICGTAVAMDINPLPLNAAQRNIEKNGLDCKISLRLSNGLDSLKRGEADVIVIAGMGGLLMRDILQNGDAVIDDNTMLILQPMLAARELREYLYESGFDVCDEYVCREINKFYNIITARRGNGKHTEYDAVVGRNLKENSPNEFPAYVDYKLRVLGNIAEGMKKASEIDDKELNTVLNEIKVFEKARNMI